MADKIIGEDREFVFDAAFKAASETFSTPMTEPIKSSPSVFPPTDKGFLLRETGFRFLRENGGYILREV